MGYDQPIEGRGPISGYAFYYRNDPNFIRTNLTLRLAIAPVFIDSELGFIGGKETDWSLGLAGGGFADSYAEIRRGKFLEPESFTGHGGEVSFGFYQRFNPNQIMPFSGIAKLGTHYSTYSRDSDTDPAFVLPKDRASIFLRTGFRLGGVEPTIFPRLGAELSVWYEVQFRTQSGTYGYGDRKIQVTLINSGGGLCSSTLCRN